MTEINLLPDSLKFKIKKKNKVKYSVCILCIILFFFGYINISLLVEAENYKKEESSLRKRYNFSYIEGIISLNDSLVKEINKYKEYSRRVSSINKENINILEEIRRLKGSVPEGLEIIVIKYVNREVSINTLCSDYNLISEYIKKLQSINLYKDIKINEISINSENSLQERIGYRAVITVLL